MADIINSDFSGMVHLQPGEGDCGGGGHGGHKLFVLVMKGWKQHLQWRRDGELQLYF